MSTIDALIREQNPPAPILPKEREAVTEIVTPTGVTIRYEDKRHYYWINGVKVDSVSKILGCLDKPALPWWGMKVGVEGVQTLLRADSLGAPLQDLGVDAVVEMLTANKLTVNHVRDKAGARGTTVHDALETWANDGTLPDPDAYPDEQRGYVQGLLAFIDDAAIQPGATEVIVGSLKHGFAGRYDLRAILADCELCTRLDKNKKTGEVKQNREIVPGGSYLPDLKTTGGIYLEQFLQLEAYEGASVECGYSPTDYRAVLRVTSEGLYEFVRSEASYADFLAVKTCHDVVAELKKRQGC